MGAVRLSAGSGAYLYLLGPAIRAFRRQSRARLTLYQHDQAETLAALRSASAQLGWRRWMGSPRACRRSASCECRRCWSCHAVIHWPASAKFAWSIWRMPR